MQCGKKGLLFLSPAPVVARARRELGENNCFWSDSLIPLKSETGIPNQTNHQSLTGHLV